MAASFAAAPQLHARHERLSLWNSKWYIRVAVWVAARGTTCL